MTARFPASSRLLHWIMSILVIAQLFIGVAMVASLSSYHWLIEIHKPLGMLILVLVALRLLNRLVWPATPLPAAMPGPLRFAAHASHVLLYAIMFALPLIGWGMLSAAGYPIQLADSFHLPAIVSKDDALYSLLQPLHAVLALVLFITFLVHLGAALVHALIFRDGAFQSMASWRR
jgi:cytochrome b561